MQKISSYLYPNRIMVQCAQASLPTEWRIVYQRRIKIYKGLTNTIEFDFKNGQQRPMPVLGFDIKCVVTDINGLEVYTGDVTPVSNKTGLARLKIAADTFDHIDQQFLNYSLYLINDLGERTPVYADTQFGVVGNIELISNAMPRPTKSKTIESFTSQRINFLSNREEVNYYSSAAFVRPRNDLGDSETITLDFVFNNFAGEVVIQMTKHPVISSDIKWTDLETFEVTPSTKFLTKSYYEVKDFDDDICWIRAKYTKTDGSIQKIIVRFNAVPYANIIDGDDADPEFNENSMQLDGGLASDSYTTNNTYLDGGGA
jgi:hypothetical protein